MAASRAKLRAHRQKAAEKLSVKLVEPMAAMSVEPEAEKIIEKVKTRTKRSALVPGEGISMGMDSIKPDFLLFLSIL